MVLAREFRLHGLEGLPVGLRRDLDVRAHGLGEGLGIYKPTISLYITLSYHIFMQYVFIPT